MEDFMNTVVGIILFCVTITMAVIFFGLIGAMVYRIIVGG